MHPKLADGARRKYKKAKRTIHRRAQYSTANMLRKMLDVEGVGISDVRYYKKIIEIVPEIASYKKTTIRHLIKTAGERGFKNLKEYYSKLRFDEDERAFLRVNLTLKGTHFFRGDDWEAFNKECLSAFSGRDSVKVWCAGCSSGEEAYSTIMSLLDYVPIKSISVLASDYNDELLAKCDEGSYFNMHYEEVPERYRSYLDLGEKKFTVKQDLRDVVTTRNINLTTDEYPAGFDIIVCRNVIKFFSKDVNLTVKRKLIDSLNPGGCLFVSTDDDHHNLELVENAAEMGLRQIEDRGLYMKEGTEASVAERKSVSPAGTDENPDAFAAELDSKVYHVDEIPLDLDLKNELKKALPEVFETTELSNFDIAFLCGLIKWKRPKNIVEVGVSAGGTTAALVYRLQSMDYDYSMYSIDISKTAYRQPDKEAGYVGAMAVERFGAQNHKFMLGTILPDKLDEIGPGIDFLILDTTHVLPGEVLEFLAAYPYLEDGAVVCMHDLRLNFRTLSPSDGIATNALMNSVVAEKYIGTDNRRSFGYPNIGAFIVGPETGTYITNVFGTLTQCWKTIPPEQQLRSYTQIIERTYSKEALWIYHRAIQLNREFMELKAAEARKPHNLMLQKARKVKRVGNRIVKRVLKR